MTTFIDLTPIMTSVVYPALASVLTAAGLWLVTKIAAYFHIQIQDSQRVVVASAISSGLAYAEKTLGNAPGITADAKVAAAVNYILPKVPAALKSLGVTPDHLAEIVTAKLPT